MIIIIIYLQIVEYNIRCIYSKEKGQGVIQINISTEAIVSNSEMIKNLKLAGKRRIVLERYLF